MRGSTCRIFLIKVRSNALKTTISALTPFLKRRGLLNAGYDVFTVSQARDVLGTTRKYALPLLGEMDRRGITAREGEGRRFRSAISCGEQE